jgi:hypothetical protein
MACLAGNDCNNVAVVGRCAVTPRSGIILRSTPSAAHADTTWRAPARPARPQLGRRSATIKSIRLTGDEQEIGGRQDGVAGLAPRAEVVRADRAPLRVGVAVEAVTPQFVSTPARCEPIYPRIPT